MDRHCFVSWVASSPSPSPFFPETHFGSLLPSCFPQKPMWDSGWPGDESGLVSRFCVFPPATLGESFLGTLGWSQRRTAACFLWRPPPVVLQFPVDGHPTDHHAHGPCGFPWHCKQPALPMGKMKNTLARLDAVTFEMRVTLDQALVLESHSVLLTLETCLLAELPQSFLMSCLLSTFSNSTLICPWPLDATHSQLYPRHPPASRRRLVPPLAQYHWSTAVTHFLRDLDKKVGHPPSRRQQQQTTPLKKKRRAEAAPFPPAQPHPGSYTTTGPRSPGALVATVRVPGIPDSD